MDARYEMPQDKGRKLNWRQACRVIGCGRSKFYELINTGKLRAFRPEGVSRGVWVWEEDCHKLIKPLAPKTSGIQKNSSVTTVSCKK